MDRLLAQAGVARGEFEGAKRLVPFDIMRRLAQAMPEDLRAGFGLVLGELTPVTSQGPIGAAMAASATLGEALQCFAEFGGARGLTARVRYTLTSDFADLELIELFDFGDLRHIVIETGAIQILKLMAATTGQAPSNLAFAFPYAPPPWAERYAAHLPGRITFDASQLRIRIPRPELMTPCLAADPQVREAALRECRREAAELDLASRRELAPIIRSRLAEADDGYPSLDSIAASLGVSPRTLIRRLRANGLRYRALVDEVRADLACWRLTHTDDTVEVIAADLGYGDTSNFSRTFRRWRGETPSEFRRRSTANAQPGPGGPSPRRSDRRR